MLGKTSWYSIDVSGNDRHILLFYKKGHFCHLLPFAKVGQHTSWGLHVPGSSPSPSFCFLAFWQPFSFLWCMNTVMSVNFSLHLPHSNTSSSSTQKKACRTCYCILVQWNLFITRSLGPYENYLVISGISLYQGKKQRNIKSWDQQNYLL